MSQSAESGYDPETVAILQTALDDAWNALSPARRTQMTRTEIASRILKCASGGERDPAKLRAAAVTTIVAGAELGGR